MDSVDNEFGPVAETVLSTLKLAGVKVQTTLTWNTIYHHGYMTNPFDELVEKTFMDTRSMCKNYPCYVCKPVSYYLFLMHIFFFFFTVYVILGHHYEHVGLMLSLKHKGLLEKGMLYMYNYTSRQKYMQI